MFEMLPGDWETVTGCEGLCWLVADGVVQLCRK